MYKTFIIHVSEGYEDRRRHIDKHLPRHGLDDFEYMLRGDIADLSDELRTSFFSSSLSLAQMSCTYKHYLVMKKVVEENIPYALVLEDDAILLEGFADKLNLMQAELNGRVNFIINIEEASNSVPLAIREPNKRLYPCKVNKLSGGLYYDFAFAERMVKHMEANPVVAPIDGLIGNERDRVGYNLMWSQPSLVKQGSKNGMFESELSNEDEGRWALIKSWYKDNYRKHIRAHLSSKQRALFIDVKTYD